MTSANAPLPKNKKWSEVKLPDDYVKTIMKMSGVSETSFG